MLGHRIEIFLWMQLNCFEKMVSISEFLYLNGKFNEALKLLSIAARYATFRNFGIYYSLKIENLLINISEKFISFSPHQYLPKSNKILHLISEAYPVGGHTKLLINWIRINKDFSHDILITNQSNKDLDKVINNEFLSISEKVTFLNDVFPKDDYIKKSSFIHKESLNYEFIVMHAHPFDIQLFMGLKLTNRPIIYVNHSDHTFWLGVLKITTVSEIRESGKSFSVKYRGISPNNSILLPIPLENPNFKKIEENKSLKLKQKEIIILTIAKKIKFNPTYSNSLFEIYYELLSYSQNVKLIVIGPIESDYYFSELSKMFPNRVSVLGEINDLIPFYSIANIYIDSYPFNSFTSLLDAAKNKIPILSLKYKSIELDDPALNKLKFSFTNKNNLITYAKMLIASKRKANIIGHRNFKIIQEFHLGSSWNNRLNALYKITNKNFKNNLFAFNLNNKQINHIFSPYILLFNDKSNVDFDLLKFFIGEKKLLRKLLGLKLFLILFNGFFHDFKLVILFIFPSYPSLLTQFKKFFPSSIK
jgi:hypothetical protein